MMVNEKAMLAKEEEHWSSFRNAVACLQSTLSQVTHTSPRFIEENVMKCNDDTKSEKNSHRRRNRCTVSRKIASGYDTDVYNENASLQSRPQDVAFNDTQTYDENCFDTTSSHRMEVIGLEKVHLDNSWNSSGNSIDMVNPGHLIPPTRNGVPSHASQASQAFSLAEQQLLETKLKLAISESERDELEFKLIQGGSAQLFDSGARK